MLTHEIIFDQIKRQDPLALFSWGAHKFIFSKGTNKHMGFLEFTATNNPNHKSIRINITLEFDDTYTIEAYTLYRRNKKVHNLVQDVYFDNLIEVIDEILG